MYKTKNRFFIITKKEWYIMKPGNMRDFFKRFDDYEIKECTEEKIKRMIEAYNIEQDVKFFNRYKTEEFYFVRTKELEIGKYKSGKIEVLEIWEN